jgi:hypothetical protein
VVAAVALWPRGPSVGPLDGPGESSQPVTTTILDAAAPAAPDAAPVVVVEPARDAEAPDAEDDPPELAPVDARLSDAGLTDAGQAARPARADAGRGRADLTPAPSEGPRADGGVVRGRDSSVVTGPAQLTLPVDGRAGGDEIPAEVRAARSCPSAWALSGGAKLTVSDCKKSCVVVFEGTSCAGRVGSELPVPSGNKSVAVVCDGAVVADRVLKLRDGQTTALSCR